MKSVSGLKVVLFVAIGIGNVYMAATSVAETWGYYRTSPVPWLIILGTSAVLGVAVLIYHDRVPARNRAWHAWIATMVLALVFLALAVWNTVLLWHMPDLFSLMPLGLRIVILLFTVLPYAVTGGLLWYANVLRKRSRDFGQPSKPDGRRP